MFFFRHVSWENHKVRSNELGGFVTHAIVRGQFGECDDPV